MAMNWITNSGFLTNNELSMDYQKAAQPLMRFRQFVQVKEAYGKGKGETVNWLKVGNANSYGGQLVETRTFHETDQTLTWGTVTVDEIGNAIPFTFRVEALSEFDLKSIIREGLVDDTAKVIDGYVANEFNSCALRYVGTATNSYVLTTNGTATASNTSVLNAYHVRKMVLELKKRNAPGYGRIGGDYAGILSLEAYENMQGELLTVNQYTETGYKKILSGEVGRFHGVRFVEDSFASRFTYNPTARTANAITWGQSQSLPAYIFGGPTVREAVAEPEHIRMKVATDYGRSKGLAWYMIGGWRIEREDEPNARIIRWDSAG